MKQILVRTSWDCPYNNDFSCQQGFVSECCEKDGVFPAKCRLKDAPQEVVEAKPKQRTTNQVRRRA
jgi:hypothetical protein